MHNSNGLHRRRFLIGTAGALASASTRSLVAFGADDDLPRPSQLVRGKDDRLLVHKDGPVVMGTPDRLLRQDRVTSKQLLFVRNNFDRPELMNLDPRPLAGWQIEIVAGTGEPRAVDAASLVRLDHAEHEMVLQCSGNGRSMFSRSAQTLGTQWDRDAVGNVRFGGAPLAAVFEAAGVSIDEAAGFLTAEGADGPDNPHDADFEHSVPLHVALERSILATHLNGELLPAIHGGPVRLVTPGYYATMNVKWVTRLRLESQETDNLFQAQKYRTPKRPIRPGTEYEFTFDNSDPNWDMRINSRILNPTNRSSVHRGANIISGVAWNDGGSPLVAVELSMDLGRSWRRAELTVPHSAYAWYDWQATVELVPRQQTIWSRAVDALGRSQPIDGSIFWNPRGYTWNEVDKVTLDVS